MVVESNPMVSRLSIVVVDAKEEWTKVRRHWELQSEVHCGYHVPPSRPWLPWERERLLGRRLPR